MMWHRLRRLTKPVVCAALVASAALSIPVAKAQQQTNAPATPAQQQRPQQTTPPKPANPFETVPEEKAEPPKPAPPATVTTVPGVTAAPAQNIIEDIEFRGNRRVPQDTLRALIFSKKGDPYDEEALHRDFIALWNTARFDDIRLEREPGKTGWIVRFVVVERRVVRSIKYENLKSLTTSEVLDRFKERKVGLSVESQYDPGRVQRAAVVIKEYLAERGRQFATVTPRIRQIPPSSLEVVFDVNEGAKVKVGSIDIENNRVFNDRIVIRAMKNLKPIGIPYSILFENLFARSFDSTKLEEDSDRIRDFYQQKGYFTARVTDAQKTIVDTGGHGIRIPILKPNKPGKAANLKLTVEEGKQYHLGKINFTGVKFFRTPESFMKPIFGMSEGDVFSTAKLRKGLEDLRKLYGEFGFIDFVPEPNPEPVPNTDKIDLTIAVDEGKQFFVRRIDFTGNTTTRDKVIRRELLIDEGQLFSTRLWEISLLRLNQLGYFEPLKKEDAADIKRDLKTNTVDITLKVKERGKNSVSLSGGVSGISGSYVSFGYETNNFLGLGETLGLNAQLGTRIRSVQFSFTEPYFLDKPLQVGFTLNTTRFNYDQAREASILAGQNLISLFNQLGSQNLLNYVTTGYGGSLFASYPLRRSFARLGLTYGFNTQNIKPLSEGATNQFEYFNFRSISGPNALNGIRTSSVTPSYQYNTVNSPISPTGGKSLFVSVTAAGGPLQGNVNEVMPTIDASYFHKGFKSNQVIGAHVLGRFITGYSGQVAPPFNRFYMGGEQDIRGFDIWGISPIAYIPSNTSIQVYNNDGTPRQQKVIDQNGVASFQPVTQNVPYYQLVFPGGDTQIVTNLEYRFNLIGNGTLTLAPFLDTGVNRISLASQLGISPDRLNTLTAQFPTADFSQRAQIAPGTQKIRMSTGIELKVLLPIVQAPFRIYWAYNPMRVDQYLLPPIPFDRSIFPNDITFQNAIQGTVIGQPQPFFEKARTFRFTIGKTF